MKFTDLYSPALGFDSIWIAIVFHFLLMILFWWSCLKATRMKAYCAGDYTKRKSGWLWKDAYTKKVSRRGAEDRDAKGESHYYCRKPSKCSKTSLMTPTSTSTSWCYSLTYLHDKTPTKQNPTTPLYSDRKWGQKGFPQAWKWLPRAVICLRKPRTNSFLIGYNVIGTANSECSKLNK